MGEMRSELVPFGVMMTSDGTARTSEGEHVVIILREHPRVEAWKYAGILKAVENITETYGQFMLYDRRIKYIKRVMGLGSRSKRWAPLEPIGSVVGNLFGLVTTSEMDDLRNAVNSIIKNQREQKKVTEGIVTVVSQMQSRQKQIARKVNQMAESLGLMQEYMVNTQRLLRAEDMLSILEIVCHEIIHFEDKFRRARGIVEIGKLNSEVISRNDLRVILKQVGSEFNPNYVYRNLPADLMMYNETVLMYRLVIPLLSKDNFNVYHVVQVPFPYQGQLLKIRPELMRFGKNIVTNEIVNLMDCQYQNPVICDKNVYFKSLPCIQTLQTDQPDLTRCQLEAVQTRELYLEKLNDRELLFLQMGLL